MIQASVILSSREAKTRERLERILRAEGLDPRSFDDAEQALREFAISGALLFILDSPKEADRASLLLKARDASPDSGIAYIALSESRAVPPAQGPALEINLTWEDEAIAFALRELIAKTVMARAVVALPQLSDKLLPCERAGGAWDELAKWLRDELGVARVILSDKDSATDDPPGAAMADEKFGARICPSRGKGGYAQAEAAPWASIAFMTDPVRRASYLGLFRSALQLYAFRLDGIRLSDEIIELSDKDPLTGAMSRRGFEELLARELERSIRYGHRLTLVVLLVKGIREIKAAEGRAEAEKLLLTVAIALRDQARTTDYLCKADEDEFLLMMPGIGAEDAYRAARRIVASVGEECAKVMGSARVSFEFGAVEPSLMADVPRPDLASLERSAREGLGLGG